MAAASKRSFPLWIYCFVSTIHVHTNVVTMTFKWTVYTPCRGKCCHLLPRLHPSPSSSTILHLKTPAKYMCKVENVFKQNKWFKRNLKKWRIILFRSQSVSQTSGSSVALLVPPLPPDYNMLLRKLYLTYRCCWVETSYLHILPYFAIPVSYNNSRSTSSKCVLSL